MTKSLSLWFIFLVMIISMRLMCCPVVFASVSSTYTKDIGFCESYTWLFGVWVASPRIPLLADVNDDGYVDFLYASPAERFIDVSLNGRGFKPIRGQRFLSDLPQTILSMCCVYRERTAIITILTTDGMLIKALGDENGNYTTTSLGSIEGIEGKVWLLAGKLISMDNDDLAIITPDGAVRLVVLQTGKPICQYRIPGGIIAVATGDIDGDGQAEIAIQTKQKVTLYQLGETAKMLVTISNPSGQPALSMGDVNADGKEDLLVNGCVFLGPGLKESICIDGWDSFSNSVLAFLADVNGDGRADVVVQHEGPDYYGSREADCNVYLTYHQDDSDWDDDGLSNAEENKLCTNTLNRDTDCDGLLDGWEVHGFGGFDFPALGASPLHKDIFIINQLIDGSSPDQIRDYMRNTILPFFDSLPYINLDGKQGFAIHFIFMSSITAKQKMGKSWEQLADELFPRDYIGLWHWMAISGMCGSGQSGLLSDVGSTGMDSWIHELGHQLGLTHSGKWSVSSPTYTSLMNYAYCGQFDGQWENTHFSTGELSALVLNEQRLLEEVPYPYEKLKFLSSNPYEFRMKSLGPNKTWIDWNWNGILDDKPVKANISWEGGVDIGQGFNPSGKPMGINDVFSDYTDFAPELVVHADELYYLVIKRPPINPNNPRSGSGPLVMSRYQGNHSFGTAKVIATSATNDPSAVSDGKTFYIFYPTSEGVMYRFGQPDNLSAPFLIQKSVGYYVRAFVWRSTIYVLLYSGADKSILYCTVNQDIIGPVHDLGIKSTIPPGVTIDTIHDQLLLGTAQTQGNIKYRWQLHRFTWDDKTGAFKQVSWEWLGGEKISWQGNGRLNLIFDARPDAGPEGRVFIFGRGFEEQVSAMANIFMIQNIAYKDYNGGWLLKRLGDTYCYSRQTPGIAWFNDNIVIARTWGSNDALTDGGVIICYNGMGIADVDMADFDDISFMADYGIARSIGAFVQMPAEK